ncbi:MAG: PEP-CTERM sorting domain-containing protein [Cyanobacteriota bacterium]|nr:PEP-CTERM sorting domain-containing protein [Cyanobacteriota bacterium]
MKLQHLSTCITLIASSAIALSVEPARAFNFTEGTDLGTCDVLVDNLTTPKFKAYLDDTLIKECTTDDGFTLTASQPANGFLQGKLVDKDKKVAGVGITEPGTGPIPGEIEFGEILDVALDEADQIASFDLSFLYLPGVFWDQVYEVAEVTVNGSLTGTLTVTGETTAEWIFDGTTIDAINLDPSQEVEGGAYRVNNPFGDLIVSSLSFTAPSEGRRQPRDSDYALVAIEKGNGIFEDIPEPTTLLGLGVVGGLMAASRRQKSA